MAVGILWDPLAPRIYTGRPDSIGKALSWLVTLRSAKRELITWITFQPGW
jgi:hypothetical protein